MERVPCRLLARKIYSYPAESAMHLLFAFCALAELRP
jgi:hypothetical protein